MSKKTDTLAIARNSTSKDFQRLNPDVFGASGKIVGAVEIPDEDLGIYGAFTEDRSKPKKSGKRRKEMNKTESRFAHQILDVMVNRGYIESYEYEGETLRWPDGMRYTPDFRVLREVVGHKAKYPLISIVMVEVKGAHQWQRDVVKFRAARDRWGNQYRFEFWQEIDGVWQETR